MSTSVKVVIAVMASIVTAILVSLLVAGSAYMKYHDVGNTVENRLIAEHQRAQNTMSATATTVMDIANISERYADDVSELVRDTMQGQYGEDGSEAVVQWIQEQNVQLDSSLYRDISLAVRSGRQDFRMAQDRVIDIKRSYEQQLGALWSGFWLTLTGYPKIDLDDYDILLDQTTIDRYETGVDKSFL